MLRAWDENITDCIKAMVCNPPDHDEPSEPPVMPQFLAFFEQAAVMPPRHANPEVASIDASILELPPSLPRW